MKQISLTQGQVAIVDDKDYDYLMQWKWCAAYCKRGRRYYAVRTETTAGKQRLIGMHRFLLGVTDKNIVVDHIDHDSLNNSRNNLRTATHAQNMCNRNPVRNSSSKFVGVYKLKNKDFWIAQICKKGATKKIGSFKDEAEAARAYDNAALEAYGEFANLNFK